MTEFIFQQLQANIPALTVAGNTNVYPQRLPDTKNPDVFVIYNLIRKPVVYNMTVGYYQLTCVARTYDDANNLVNQVASLFQSKVFAGVGDPVSTTVDQITEMPFDELSKYYLFAVTVRVKSQKEITV